jgi:hypothetical protein
MHRAVDVPCVIIQGIAKSAAYEVGDKNGDRLTNSWNAVYVGGAWRIVFPLWACRCIVGHNTGNWTLIESNGKKGFNKNFKINFVENYCFVL